MTRVGFLAFLAGLGLLLAGCPSAPGPTPPRTVPVQGKVLDKNNQPLKGGTIEFRDPDNPDLRSLGVIDSNGNFTLKTSWEKGAVDGVQPGKYQVKIMPQMQGDQTAGPPMAEITVPGIFTIKEGESTPITINLK
jgi:hypothetical protein